MFGSTKIVDAPMEMPRANGGQSATTVIARGVKVEGDFASQGDVVIEGTVQGKLSTQACLTIGSEAKIVADVTAGEATIAGTIEGNLKVENRLDIKATAKIQGDIQAAEISVEAGAQLNGRLTVGAGAPAGKGSKSDVSISTP